MIVTTVVVVIFGARMYENSLLKIGARVSFAEALPSSTTSYLSA